MWRKLVITFVFFYAQAGSTGQGEAVERSFSVLEEYRELRKICAVSQGKLRIQCYRQLKRMNGDYQNAKRSLDQRKVDDNANLHVVSNLH